MTTFTPFPACSFTARVHDFLAGQGLHLSPPPFGVPADFLVDDFSPPLACLAPSDRPSERVALGLLEHGEMVEGLVFAEAPPPQGRLTYCCRRPSGEFVRRVVSDYFVKTLAPAAAILRQRRSPEPCPIDLSVREHPPESQGIFAEWRRRQDGWRASQLPRLRWQVLVASARAGLEPSAWLAEVRAGYLKAELPGVAVT